MMKRGEITFTYVAPHIVGNPSDWSYCYGIGEETYSSVKEAEDGGFGYHHHDDFFIAEFNSRGKCIAVHIDGEEHGFARFTAQSEDFGEYVKGINKELGL